jgi:hypothetical protein
MAGNKPMGFIQRTGSAFPTREGPATPTSDDFEMTPEQELGADRARADYDAGAYVDGEELAAWVDSWFTDHEKPMPTVRKR